MAREPDARPLLAGPEGRRRLDGAIVTALAGIGAPTRPGGPAGALGDRLMAGEPLTEDTDWRAPLGPFRDTSIVRGTLDELLSARLTDGRYGLDVVVDALLPWALPLLEPTLVDPLDPFDIEDRCRRGLRRAVGALGGERLDVSGRGGLAATPGHTGEGLEHDAMGNVDRLAGPVVGRGDLDDVEADQLGSLGQRPDHP